jgi:23S rRNA (cytosine1962-C5)-methyltransferase
MLSVGGQPVPDDFWRRRIDGAIRLRRETLRLDEATDAYRLIHAEGDGLSGLVAERLGDCLVFEVFSLGVWQRIRELAELTAELMGPPPGGASAWRTVVRADERSAQLEGFKPRHGQSDHRRAVVSEYGVRYRVDLAGGHKTGFFCDQRDNRRAFAGLCRDAAVLDLCCYSGGFGVAAAKLGGAREVTSVDLDEAAVALARENANLNQVRVQQVHADVYGYLRQMIANGRQYDAVVLDPPKLIATREQFREGRQRYLDFNKLALAVVRPGGVLLTCSCSGLMPRDSFLDVIRQAARIAGRSLSVFNVSGAAPDHPIALDCPETEYLKAVWLRVI